MISKNLGFDKNRRLQRLLKTGGTAEKYTGAIGGPLRYRSYACSILKGSNAHALVVCFGETERRRGEQSTLLFIRRGGDTYRSKLAGSISACSLAGTCTSYEGMKKAPTCSMKGEGVRTEYGIGVCFSHLILNRRP